MIIVMIDDSILDELSFSDFDDVVGKFVLENKTPILHFLNMLYEKINDPNPELKIVKKGLIYASRRFHDLKLENPENVTGTLDKIYNNMKPGKTTVLQKIHNYQDITICGGEEIDMGDYTLDLSTDWIQLIRKDDGWKMKSVCNNL